MLHGVTVEKFYCLMERQLCEVYRWMERQLCDGATVV